MIGTVLIRPAAGNGPGQLPVAVAVAEGELFSGWQSLLPPRAGGQAYSERRDQNRRQSPSGMESKNHRRWLSAHDARKMASDGTSRRAAGSSGRPLARVDLQSR